MRGNFSRRSRRDALQRAADVECDLLVAGGGITGAGVAREAALRGLSVVLVDKGDFASGTSSRSSKLIHGGLRYLEQGDIALVRESSRERAVLNRIAPHLAVPLDMLVPARSKAGLAKLAAGLWTFKRLNRSKEGYSVLGRSASRAKEPLLGGSRLAGSVVFKEYLTDDARLTLETIKSAAAAGALVANYAEITAIEDRPGGLGVTVLDNASDSSLEIRCRCLVNAAGPWFDSFRRLRDRAAAPLLQLTRGVHLVLKRSALPLDCIVVLRAPDGRSAFAVPRGETCYVGTTDHVHEGEIGEPGVTAEEAAYLLEAIYDTTGVRIDAEAVVGAWSGVRPLMAQAGKGPSEISRRDEILVGPGPIVSVAGGKLTTYRRTAERVVNRAVEACGLRPAGPADSGAHALAGGDAEEQARARSSCRGLSDERLEGRLWATYGINAASIIERMIQEPGLVEPVGGLADLTLAELEYSLSEEMAMSLDDLLRRRSRAAMFDSLRAIAAAPEVASQLAGRLGWDPDHTATEVESFVQRTETELGIAKGAGRETLPRSD